jgi:hypothetical protein
VARGVRSGAPDEHRGDEQAHGVHDHRIERRAGRRGERARRDVRVAAGTAWCGGVDNEGQLGDGDALSAPRFTPVRVLF